MTRFSAAALSGLTYGLQAIEGPHHAGEEFPSLAQDFDTSTATVKLQLAMVLAFSEWWRNSFRKRSVEGQAKARIEGRFPGRRPSLSEQQREYIREERSKGVNQRELAKPSEVSHWTIQQVDGLELDGTRGRHSIPVRSTGGPPLLRPNGPTSRRL